MAAPIRFLSGRNQQQKIGIEGSTDNQKVLEVVGRVGIGTTIFEPTSELEVRGDVIISGILTAGNIEVSTGQVNFSQLNVSGVSTFAGAADFNGSIDVDGHTELDNVNVSGVSTFVGLGTFKNDLYVSDNVYIAGFVTATRLYSSVFGEFTGSSVSADNLVGSALSISGLSTFTGAAEFKSSIDVDGHTELDDLKVSGVSTFTGAADFNGDLDVDGHTELDNVNVSGAITATTFTGNLAGTVNTAAQPNITSVGTLSALTVSGDITANGNIAGDNSTNITGIAGVTATTLSGTLQTAAQTNVTSVGTLTGLDVNGHTELDDVNVSGASTFTGAIDANGSLDVDGHTELDDLNVSGVSTFTGAADFNGSIDVDGHSELDDVNVSGASTFTGAADFNGSIDVDGLTNLDEVNVSGLSTFTADIGAGSGLPGQININPTTATSNGKIKYSGQKTFVIEGGTNNDNKIEIHGHQGSLNILCEGQGETELYYNNSKKLATTGIGISIANGAGNTAYIEGPSEIWIDPHPFGVGQTSGSVRIRGDLYVDGTEFIVDVDKIELGDFNIGIASTVSTNSLLDGAGLGIGATSIRKFITWNNATSALMSSENWNLASGKHYEIAGTDVLTSDTLGSGVINSSLTSVGTLGALTVSGNVNANGNIIGDGATNISGINSVTATTLSGTLQTAAQTNITSVGTLGALTVSGNVNANGNIIGDSATNISGINSVTATSFYGSGSNLTGISAGQIADVGVTIREEGSLVGTAKSVKNINFVGSNLTATASGVGATITITDTPTFSSLNVTGTTTIPNISGVTTFANVVNVGTGITFYASTGIISATTFFGNGENLSNLINQRIEGLQIFDEGVAVGTGYTFAALDVVGSNISISAVGLGTTARITLSDTPTFDTVAVTNNITANGNIVGDNSTNISGINSVTATLFHGSGANLTSIPNSALTNDSVSFGGVSLDLGQTDATPAFNLSDATNYPTSSLTGTITNAQLAGSIADGKLASTFLKNVVEDTTPQLGGNLDFNSKFITGTGGINVSGVVTATTFSGNATSATTATTATNFTVTSNNGSNENVYPVFVDGFSGSQGGETDTDLSYNPSTNTFTAGTFSGALSGNGSAVTNLNASNLSTGTVPSARMSGTYNIESATFTVQANNSANETVYPVFVDGATGAQGAETDTGLSYNPSTGLFTAVAFSGSGASLTSLPVPTTITVADESSDTTCFPLFATAATGDLAPKSGSNLTFNSSTGALTATSFVGNLTGTASNASGATGDFSIADKIVHTGDTDTAIRFPAADTFTVETAGNERLRIDSSGRLLVGSTSAWSGPRAIIRHNTSGATSEGAILALASNTNAASGFSPHKVGQIHFTDNTGGQFATINCHWDGTAGTDDYPGRLVFSTTADGSDTPTERLRITSDGKVRVPDNGMFTAGAGDDLKIYHSGSVNYIAGDDLRITNNAVSETMAKFIADGAVELNYNDSKKFETTSAGVTVTGTLTASALSSLDTLTVSGISNLNNDVIFDGASYNASWDKSANTFNFTDNARATFGNGGDLEIFHNGTNTIIQSDTGDLQINSGNSAGNVEINLNNNVGADTREHGAKFIKNGASELYFNNSKKFETTSSGITVTGGVNATGVVTATSLDAAISEWVLGANGSSDYTFTGPGLTGAENDPSIYLVRGQKYNFKNSSGGHPFRIQSTPNGSTGTQYNDGITNNDAGNGVTLNWNVQFDAPDVLYYQCTSHAAMGGKIYIGNSGESIVVGAAVTINSSGINATGVVTATSFAGDGSSLTNIVSPSSNGEFYTGITSSRQIAPLSFESTVFTFPSTAGRQYVIESINVANVDASVGVGTTVNIIASIQDATAAEQTYIAYNVPIVTGGLIELLKNPIVAGPSDVIKMWSTNDGYTGVSNAAEVYMNYSEFTSTDYISKFASTTTINSTDTITLYTSTSNPTTIEKIGFANRTDTGDFPISIKITNGTTTSYLAKDLIIPRYSTVDILDRPKRIETGAKIEVEVGSTSTVDVIISGKKITS